MYEREIFPWHKIIRIQIWIDTISRRPLATPSTDFTMRQHLQLSQPLQSCNSAIGGTRSRWRSYVRHLHALTCWRSLSAQSLHDAIVGLHRRHDGQLCHRPDWKPTAATQATSTATNGSSIFTADLLATASTSTRCQLKKMLNIWMNEIFCLTLPPRKPEKRH